MKLSLFCDKMVIMLVCMQDGFPFYAYDVACLEYLHVVVVGILTVTCIHLMCSIYTHPCIACFADLIYKSNYLIKIELSYFLVRLVWATISSLQSRQTATSSRGIFLMFKAKWRLYMYVQQG